jgi:hypothetical protein
LETNTPSGLCSRIASGPAVAGTTASVQQAAIFYADNGLTYAGVTAGLTAAVYDCGFGYPAEFPAAVNGAIAQYGRLSHLNVGTWPDTGMHPEMTEGTAQALVDWASAALTTQALKGRRVVIFGHDSMGMETALGHVIPTRNQFGIEITRLDMKLLADMLNKKAGLKLPAKELWAQKGLGLTVFHPATWVMTSSEIRNSGSAIRLSDSANLTW